MLFWPDHSLLYVKLYPMEYGDALEIPERTQLTIQGRSGLSKVKRALIVRPDSDIAPVALRSGFRPEFFEVQSHIKRQPGHCHLCFQIKTFVAFVRSQGKNPLRQDVALVKFCGQFVTSDTPFSLVIQNGPNQRIRSSIPW